MTTPTFRKSRHDAPAGFFACEAAGLRWLGEAADGAPVVAVLDVADDHLDLARLTSVRPTRDAAVAFGRALAGTHDAGAPAFGSPPPAWGRDGFFGPLDAPLVMPAGEHERWGDFLARRRLQPLAAALDRAGVVPARAFDALVTRLLGGDLDDDDRPARLHGDLWSGNVMWTAQGATLVDPAAHGGHRETDLAMLHLFGLPFLDDVVAGYGEVHALRPGWRERLGLHQVYPVGVHALLFGGGYVAQLRRLLERWGR
ncbi:fructosamine kinase family protein [Cellulomonas alba]|uniref:Fructosamine kinase family protein n=1 Tax=Cellulomonas alba TaxID=3053467 RepID=A0ABT7SJN7_9CELL|nr:fructosamine kinase family protein [Cellulomonas alba]MDM7856395.1 fructosamine kinase family protein [Cellulomonas alba]